MPRAREDWNRVVYGAERYVIIQNQHYLLYHHLLEQVWFITYSKQGGDEEKRRKGWGKKVGKPILGTREL